MKWLFFLLLLGAGWLAVGLIDFGSPLHSVNEHHPSLPASKPAIFSRTELRLAALYAIEHRLSTTQCLLAKLSRPSGQNRIFLYDLKKDTILYAGLMAHGSCNERWLEGRKYGNTIGCGCSSLGHYRIGNAYDGNFGRAYKLYGLDSTNSNAYARYIVLHSYTCVPEQETGGEICQSLGCAMVSPGSMRYLDSALSAHKKPMLLWMME